MTASVCDAKADPNVVSHVMVGGFFFLRLVFLLHFSNVLLRFQSCACVLVVSLALLEAHEILGAAVLDVELVGVREVPHLA